MRSDKERLLDILEAIDKIEQRIPPGKELLAGDDTTQVWILYHVQIIGEAASRLSQSLQDEHPQIPWSDIVSMRNVIVHHYFGIDLDQVWDAVQNDIPRLKEWVTDVLGGSFDGPGGS